ncbi:MAG: DNA polymerase I [Rickettsiaceae bacterium H1]|nr:DNA polymerase I [Rickettsiaceae bacterium H1]
MSRLILIDAYGFLFRAYHALPPLMNPKGEPVGAVYGFLNMLLKAFSEHKATHWAAICDTGKKTFREEIFSGYKANRGEPDDDLIPQFSLLQEALAAFNMPCISAEGYEADDVIATLATTSKIDVTVISSDKDLMQLISEKIKMFDPMKNKFINEQDVITKFGVTTDKLLDCFALIGDSSDNIPGVPGIGPKTATLLINEFGSLENLLNNLEQIKQNKRRETLRQNIDQAYLSKKLARLCDDVKLDTKFDNLIFTTPKQENLIPFLRKHEFKVIINKVEKLFYPNHNNNKEIKITQDLKNLITECKQEGMFSICFHFNQLEIELLGISTNSNNYLISYDQVNSLQEIFVSPNILKISYNVKLLLKYFDISPFADIDVMAYTLNTTKENLQDLSYRYLEEQLPANPALQAREMIKLYEILREKLFEQKSVTLYERLDRASISVLDSIEKNGVLIDSNVLKTASKTFEQNIENIEREIFKLAGHRFNIASPKQLANVMFTEMGIRGGKKLKSGNYSTNNEVLESLALQGIEFAEKVLSWRHFSKLKNTYTDSLLSHINKKTKRIHTTYSLTNTSTGRLSSNNPNLQNIPKNKESNIRKAFIAAKECVLISADYSQIELRLLAHIANIADLKQALSAGEDLHSVTAKQIFGESNDDLRRKAKAINFGIIYGISPFGLAKQLNIGNTEAQEYITNYFNRYPGIETYMKEIKDYARSYGYVKTIYGRRCYLKDINSKSFPIRSFTERAAINAPLQGSAADIMKDAMVKLSRKLTSGKIILQIHDELIIESPKEKLEYNVMLIKTTLENTANLTVPMKVNVSYGDNLNNLTELL